MLYQEFGELGPEFRLPDDLNILAFNRPSDYESTDPEKPIPQALPLHGLMVQRDFGDIDSAIDRLPENYENVLNNLKFQAPHETNLPLSGPLLGIGFFKEMLYPPMPWRPDEQPYHSWEFCLSGFALPEMGFFRSTRGPNDSSCLLIGTWWDEEDRDKYLQQFKPLDQSSPWVRAMLRHLREWDWDRTSIVHEDRMVDTSLDPPKASRFGEWWEEEFYIRPPRYIYHITYPAEIAQIRDSGVLLPYRGYARLTWCPEQMVGNTFGASRFIRIPVEDIPKGLINVTYDEEFVLEHPEIAETISEYVWELDREKLNDPSYVSKMVAEISRYRSECEAVYPGALPLPPSTEWGIPAIGPMGLLFE